MSKIIYCTATVSQPKMFVAASQQLMSVIVIFNFQYIQQSSIIYFTFSMHNNNCNSAIFTANMQHKIQHFYRCGKVRRLKLYCSIIAIFILQLCDAAFIHSNDLSTVISKCRLFQWRMELLNYSIYPNLASNPTNSLLDLQSIV